MSLDPYQTLTYVDECSIYRRNKTKGADGEWTYSLLASAVKCKHFTRTNYDTTQSGGGFTEAKEPNIMTADRLHLPLSQDIAAEDFVIMTASPNLSSKNVWFRVAGEPESRAGVANRSEVYLVPDVKPVVI